MKFSELWLREWVNPPINREALCDKLTMAGLEVEDVTPVSDVFSGVIIGEILTAEKHPNAERLKLCEVSAGNETLKIVCGASNARVGLKVALAKIGAKLPNNIHIQATKIRNVESFGMLCSASELGLSEESEGILELASDAPLGDDLWSYLHLSDFVIDLSITPNRSDCLSIHGIAREVSALTNSPLIFKKASREEQTFPSTIKDKLSVEVKAKEACPRYIGRIIRNVTTDQATPVFLKERLRRSGIRSINPVVDVTNYVMLELGQPLHAFDLSTIENNICVRMSKKGETIALLDGTEKVLNEETLIIADQQNPLAIAGVMGGVNSSVTSLTQDIFLESAFFSPLVIAKQRQWYGINSDSAYRFERGVDPYIQKEAIERATQLIIEIAGGEAGPLTEVAFDTAIPAKKIIKLSTEKVNNLLGIVIAENKIEEIFDRLKFPFEKEKGVFHVHIPSYRFDISIPEDLIEEIARLYGYNNIPEHIMESKLEIKTSPDKNLSFLRQALCDEGFHEVITYSFTDEKLQRLLDPNKKTYQLLNPISSDMALMRTSLWPGLIQVLRYNKSRQQERVRIFEIGKSFSLQSDQVIETPQLGLLLSGLNYAEQWSTPSKEADFFDLKGTIENLLALTSYAVTYKVEKHEALHPGQTAAIYVDDKRVGIFGALHPFVTQALNLSSNVFVAELDLTVFDEMKIPIFNEVSKFPEIRRDIALLIKESIPAKHIQDRIKDVSGTLLKEIFVFDVYKEKGVPAGFKSIALALILQHPTRTLVEQEVNDLMNHVIEDLKGSLGAELRS